MSQLLMHCRDWVIGGERGFLCQVFPVFFYANSAVTLFSLMCVTINRCMLIYSPAQSDRIFTRVKSKIIIAICWDGYRYQLLCVKSYYTRTSPHHSNN